MILEYDGLSISSWEDNIDWDRINPDGADDLVVDEDDEEILLSGVEPAVNLSQPIVLQPVQVSVDAPPRLEDFSEVLSADILTSSAASATSSSSSTAHPMWQPPVVIRELRSTPPVPDPIRTYGMEDKEDLRDDLIEHFGYEYTRGHVYWPKRFTNRQKATMPIAVPSVVSRINTDLSGYLYHKPSTLLALNRRTGYYSKKIGDGLFSHIAYNKGDTICNFVGEKVVGQEEVDRRQAIGRGGYTIHLYRDVFLDCFAYLHVCMASYANDPRNCYSTVYKTRSKANCECRMDNRTKTVMLKANRNIPPNTEILWVYGNEYVFPNDD